jgi:hypothetical protein
MSEMVERVARTMYDSIDAEMSDPDAGLHWDDLPDGPDYETWTKAFWLLRARAAIAAKREPTTAMWDACGREQADFETGIGWQVMIDEALK